MKNSTTKLLLISAVLLLSSCMNNSKTKKQATQQMKDQEIQQDTSDLLNGTSHAVCYSGFRSGQHPDRGNGAVNPTDEQVLEDLQILSQDSTFNLIRLYDSGENSQAVLRIISENKLNMKVMLGIWMKAELSAHETCSWLTEPIAQDVLDANTLENQKELKRGIQLANQYPNIVVAVNVGNECQVEWNDHKVAEDSLISYIKRVKKEIAQPVTTADNYDWWAKHGSKVAEVVDFLAIHVYPVWEGKGIEEAMSYTIANVQKVRNAIPDRKIVITEAGWATVASEFGERASEENQLKYYNDLMNWAEKMNITTFFFEAFDEDWKGETANPDGAEKHWGLYTVDRQPKKVMQ